MSAAPALPRTDSRRSVLVTAHAWYGDVIGGSFRLASEFAESLATAGWRVTYVCCAPAGQSPKPARETIHGVDVRRYPAMHERGWGWSRLRYHVRQTARWVRETLHEGPIDVLSAHSPLQGWGAAKVLRRHGVYVNYTVHSPFDDEVRANHPVADSPALSARIATAAARWVDRRNLRLAHRVQTDSRYTMDVLARRHGEWVRRKGTISPGWVDADRFRPVDNRRTVRRELGGVWNTDVPLFFTLRRLEARMGIDTLIDAAGRLRAQGRAFRVLIGGGGSLGGELEARIRQRRLEDTVHLLGRVAEEDLPHVYSACDCFVLPTRALECFGLIVLESFAAGTPVIASRVAAIPEIAGRQGDDFLFEPGNAEELADRMQRFLDGGLTPAIDLRQTACEFDRRVVTSHWQRLVIGDW